MAHYYRELNVIKREKFIRRLKLSAAFLAVVILVGFVVVFVENRQANKVAVPPAENTNETTVGYFAPSTQIFRTPFFQFQTNKSWAAALNESTENKFVYRSIQASLIEHELTIYVNELPAQLTATRVLPVTLSASKQLTAQNVSDRCGKDIADKRTPIQKITFSGVTFDCIVDDAGYTVLVGLSGGTSTLNLVRPGGQTALYAIHYRNVTANPDAVQLKEILSTFQLR